MRCLRRQPESPTLLSSGYISGAGPRFPWQPSKGQHQSKARQISRAPAAGAEEGEGPNTYTQRSLPSSPKISMSRDDQDRQGPKFSHNPPLAALPSSLLFTPRITPATKTLVSVADHKVLLPDPGSCFYPTLWANTWHRCFAQRRYRELGGWSRRTGLSRKLDRSTSPEFSGSPSDSHCP